MNIVAITLRRISRPRKKAAGRSLLCGLTVGSLKYEKKRWGFGTVHDFWGFNAGAPTFRVWHRTMMGTYGWATPKDYFALVTSGSATSSEASLTVSRMEANNYKTTV
jgi:hypothetical protein